MFTGIVFHGYAERFFTGSREFVITEFDNIPKYDSEPKVGLPEL